MQEIFCFLDFDCLYIRQEKPGAFGRCANVLTGSVKTYLKQKKKI